MLIVDADDHSKSASHWAKTGHLPFTVMVEDEARKEIASGKYDFVVVDSQIRPNCGEAEALSKGSDLLIVPTPARALDIKATAELFAELPEGSPAKVLIQMAPPPPQTDGQQAQKALKRAGIPVFDRRIRFSKEYVKASETGADMSQQGGRMPQYWRDWEVLRTELMEAINNGN